MLKWTQTSGKNQNNYGDVNDHIVKQYPLLKSTTGRVTGPCLTFCDEDCLINTDYILKLNKMIRARLIETIRNQL